jgi:hypothetical protein
MQRHLTSVTKIANNTAISCEKFLYHVYTVHNNNTIIDTLFSRSDEIVENLSSSEEDNASGPPIGTMTARATAAGKQQWENCTSWRT